MGKIKKDMYPDAKVIKLDHGVTNADFRRDNIIETIGDDINTMRKVFEIFNEVLFDGMLDTPIIYIDAHLKVEYKVEIPSGWVKIKGNKEEKDCIRLFMSEKLYKQELKAIYINLVKAMIMQYDLEMEKVHEAAREKWIRLVNNNNNYFGKKYKLECEKRGLKIVEPESEDENEVKGRKPLVVAGDKFNEIYSNYSIEENFKLVHQYMSEKVNDKKNGNKGQSMRLFKCPKCKMKIRVTKSGDVDIRCYNGECAGEKFKLVIGE